ncbi:MAG TPA: hydroxymethylbilane synthase [Burkholderiales bacterium]|nr:hydroxymethylbilane synthase [Burkholderiales bacterium]
MSTSARPEAPKRLVIASRQSRLALWQSEHVAAELCKAYPQCEVSILGLTTRGDRILDTPLSKVGGKGLFVKELEEALADGRADLAVHSAKDVPMSLPAGFCIAAIPEREDARDCIVSARYARLEDMPPGAVVGTSSLRREAQLRDRYPGLEVRSLRGNLDTRLAKLDRGEYDAVALAAAGLKRLGLAGRIRATLEPETVLPSPGQGALAIECRDDRVALRRQLAALDHRDTADCIRAERTVSRALSGSCQVPLAAYAVLRGDRLFLRGLVATPDGRRTVRAEIEGARADAEPLGEALAKLLLERGARDVLAALS